MTEQPRDPKKHNLWGRPPKVRPKRPQFWLRYIKVQQFSIENFRIWPIRQFIMPPSFVIIICTFLAFQQIITRFHLATAEGWTICRQYYSQYDNILAWKWVTNAFQWTHAKLWRVVIAFISQAQRLLDLIPLSFVLKICGC